MIYSPFLSPCLFSLTPLLLIHTQETYDIQLHGWPGAWSENQECLLSPRIRLRPLPSAHHDTSQKCTQPGTSLVAQGAAAACPQCRGPGFQSGRGAGSHAATKTWHSQINKNKFFLMHTSKYPMQLGATPLDYREKKFNKLKISKKCPQYYSFYIGF